MTPRLLVIAGSDSSGGAGIQADLKTAQAFGVYCQTAITAVTVQNTLGVTSVNPVAADIVRAQIEAALSDIGADAIKIGMLGSAEIVLAVADLLDSPVARDIPVVLDPVMISTSGRALLDAAGVEAMKSRLMPRATLLTPNLIEATALSGVHIDDTSAMEAAARRLLALGAANVLVKGGHIEGDALVDLLVEGEGCLAFRHSRVATRHTHGTGCILASAVAAGLASGLVLREAVTRAHDYVQAAIRNAPGLGQGNGPLGVGV